MVAGLLPAALVAMLTLPLVTPAVDPNGVGQNAAQPLTPASDVVLRIGNTAATATLENTPAAEQFSRMLPLQLTLRDPMGQAKSGRLPKSIDDRNAESVVELEVGGIYYWPNGDVGIVYDSLTAVPAPGAVRLGSVDRGLDSIASAGNRFDVSIDVR
jgi:hypothetical protein